MDENLENDQNQINKSAENVALNAETLTGTPDKENNKVIEDIEVGKVTENDSDEGDDIVLKKKTRRNLLDSDDDSSEPKKQIDDVSIIDNSETEKQTKKTRKRLAIVDSDSDNEDIASPTPHDKSFDENLKKEAPIYGINDQGETVIESVSDDYVRQRLSVLCDSDSSAEEPDNDHESESFNARKHVPQKSKRKSSAKKPKEDKPKSMSAKDALIQRKEIRSESQRMTREMNVSLPYHKPKPRTLQEFLEKRPRFAATVPTNTMHTPPSVALKMSRKDLEIISKNLSERERQVEEFFKSESESEDDSVPEASEHSKEIEVEKNEETITEEKTTLTKEDEDMDIDEEIEKASGDDGSKIHEEQIVLESSQDKSVGNVDNGLVGKVDNGSVDNVENTSVDNVKNTSGHNVENTSVDNVENTSVDNVPNTSVDSVESRLVHNVNKELSGKTKNSKSIVVLQNVILNSKEDNFDSGILEDLASTNETISTCLDGKNNDDTVNSQEVELCLEKNDLDMLMDKYEVAKLDCRKEEEPPVLKTPKINILELVKDKLGHVPRLSGTPNDFINFDENVNKLQERFLKHTTKKEHHKHNVQVDIVSFTNGEIHTEKLAVSVDEEQIPIFEKPGERLKQFKSELEAQMAERRSKLWQERLNGVSKDDLHSDAAKKGHESGDDSDRDEKDDILDIEDEDEFTEIEDDDDGDILDENEEADEDEEGEQKDKCAFGDEEAVESDDDGCNMEADDDDDDAENDVEEEEEEQDADDEDEAMSDGTKKKKKLKRIVKAFENDSDDDQAVTPVFENKAVNRTKSTDLLFDTTDTLDDLSGPTPHQRQDQRTPTKRTTTLTRSDLGFLTPVIQLTGLRSLNSGSKFLHDSPVSPFRMPQSSPQASQAGPQKKLFNDSQMLDDDIADLCSGIFTTQTQSEGNTITEASSSTSHQVQYEETCEEETPQTTNTQEFLEICSGKFTGMTQLEPSNTIEKISEKAEEVITKDSNTEPSRDFFHLTNSTSEEIKSLDDEDDGKLISQLIDEEEMERFKKKFESPEKSQNYDEEESGTVGRVIFDSSDEENDEMKRKKKRKNLISDDEDNEENAEGIEELIDDDEEEEEGEIEERPPDDVEYDSEENEIQVGADDRVAPKRLKTADFFENEAELSESEWGSADEDEKDLDVLEIEEGDKEQLDEDQVKRDLERIHMRRILDDDNQEVKLLQEMLLDDGELHGTGRERQFKWKNIDTLGTDENIPRGDDDGEVYLDDENEDEEKWRKMRHDREAFLKKQQEKSQIIEDDISIIDTNSQIFKLGHAAIKRSLSNTPNNTVNEPKRPSAESPEIKTSFMLMSKKGSFLTRSEHVLQRVAQFTSKTVNLTIGGPKNSRNFVFQSVTSEESQKKDMKRKASDGTPVAIKKLRLDTISPAVQKKNQKNDRAKKLFSSW